MKQNINIAALLKDCPKGTKLYSPICGECNLAGADRDAIYVYTEIESFIFTQHGKFRCDSTGECLLFPSKDIRDWGMFKVLYCQSSDTSIDLLKQHGGVNRINIYGDDRVGIYFIDTITKTIRFINWKEEMDYILSTGTELKLEKEQPKFKVGDVVKVFKRGTLYTLCISNKYWDRDDKNVRDYCLYSYKDKFDRMTLATPEEITNWNKETLGPNHLHYSKKKRKIIPWFLHKDDVVVRISSMHRDTDWMLCRFSHYNHNSNVYCYCADGQYWQQCLPYNEKTAKLIGTTDDYKEE